MDMQANMDPQFVLKEYSSAAYVAEYMNKSCRGTTNGSDRT